MGLELLQSVLEDVNNLYKTLGYKRIELMSFKRTDDTVSLELQLDSGRSITFDIPIPQ